ncbi:hypothetical protein SAMN05443634_1136 [Chishuiella changwenlii]|uniref:DUF6314 domain-containing protein n=1 Tax=Chishuiella changwenlii TaxID=1434701 RepID=A0A1M7CAA2_9FLAO|nr:DUF6314 family protein [Chishuiella changwenlii]GGF06637.1 hypothetical protein GCM10010984_24900 [Chishuiella changwenlii]SHL64066.1 hypothetical protein SAMN05443634_1136 [Chishuiella changwenlii]
MYTNKPILSFLLGDWTIYREIYSDELLSGQAEGYVTFEESESNSLSYTEKGETYFFDIKKLIPFQKKFLYEFSLDTLTVYFADGVDNGKIYQHYALEDFQNKKVESSEKHFCGNDIYQSYYVIKSDEEFFMKTIINGPKKNFIIDTLFEKVI